MTIKQIGLKFFRQNMSKLWKEAKEKNIQYIVMNHSEPVMTVKSINAEDIYKPSFLKDLAKAEAQIERGEYITAEELMHKRGITEKDVQSHFHKTVRKRSGKTAKKTWR